MNKTITLQVIKPNNPLYEECEVLCVLSKQLYNVGLYELRQELFNKKQFLSYKSLYQQMKKTKIGLPRQIPVPVFLRHLPNSFDQKLERIPTQSPHHIVYNPPFFLGNLHK